MWLENSGQDKLDLANEEGVTMVEMDGCAGSAVMETSHC